MLILDSKIFYVERVEKEPAKDVELGQDYTDQPKEQVESTEKKVINMHLN